MALQAGNVSRSQGAGNSILSALPASIPATLKPISNLPTNLAPASNLLRQKSSYQDDDMGLQWLFDPDRIDHLPIKEQLTYYRKRNLLKGKTYSIASRIWGKQNNVSRKRIINAPPMAQVEYDRHAPCGTHTQYNAPLQPPENHEANKENIDVEEGIYQDYKKWIRGRKDFNEQFKHIGLTLEYIWKKTDRTPLENSIYKKLYQERFPHKIPPPVIDPPPKQGRLPEILPKISRPNPEAADIIEEFLAKQRMRLTDLFSGVDKNKDWKVTRAEFREALEQAHVPLTEDMIEDLIVSIDKGFSDEIDYRELAKGMALWKQERRDKRRKLMINVPFSKSRTGKALPKDLPMDIDHITMDFERSRAASPVNQTSEKLSFTKKSSSMKAVVKTSSSAPVMSRAAMSAASQLSERSSHSKSGPRLAEDKVDCNWRVTTPAEERLGSGANSRIHSAISEMTSLTNLSIPETDYIDGYFQTNDEAMVDLRKRDREALKRFNAEWKEEPPRTPTPQETELSRNVGKKKVVINHFKMYKDHTVLEKSVVKTGDRAIDNHCAPSTLTGEASEMVDAFRQKRFREYHEICQICKERGVPLSEKLLKRVLLYPPDKAPTTLLSQIRQPTGPLLSKHFSTETVSDNSNENARSSSTDLLATPSPGGTPLPSRRKARTGNNNNAGVSKDPMALRTRRDDLILDTRMTYPIKRLVEPKTEKMQLSTGNALVSRKVDCWLTFEDYTKLTSHLETRYEHLHAPCDDNAFWPGRLLDKIVLVLPKPPGKRSAIFATAINRHPHYLPIDAKRVYSVL